MPNRRPDGREGDSTSKRRRRRRQHLYLVIDDWQWGYSIRKIDLSSTASDTDAAAIESTERRLPSAVFRVEAPRGKPHRFTSGFGATIVAMHPRRATDNAHPLVPRHLATAFDVLTRGIVYVPRPKTRPSSYAIYVHAGDRIFMLDAASFEELICPPPPPQDHRREEWSWRELRMPSFAPLSVTSHAVHPDGGTIFFSAGGATFTFDASEDADDRFRWTRHGEWALPFAGGAHYDRGLDAWVGLSDSDSDPAGHFCSCDVVAPDATAAARPYDDDDGNGGGEGRRCQLGPARKLSKENLFDCSENPSERHVGATLVPMGGGGSRFCLLQCTGIVCDDNDKSYSYYQRPPVNDGDTASRFLYRLTTFSLKYDNNGDLTTGDSRRVRYYKCLKNVPVRTVL